MTIVKVGPEDRELLWNVTQKYLYEMTGYYDDEMDASGVLHYGYFDEYFTDPRRMAFFFRDNERPVGFAMIHPYSSIGGSPDYVMAEFTVFPAYRRRFIATEAAAMLFERFKGRWEVKFNEKNTAAKALWSKATASYCPRATRLNEEETVFSFET